MVFNTPIKKVKKPRVFLGGTCTSDKNRDYRNELIPLLKCEYFNPVVDEWTEECKQREIEARKECDYVLYVITSDMTGVYSIAEVVDDSNKRPNNTLFMVNYDGFTKQQINSLKSVENMVKNNGAIVFDNLQEIASYLNHFATFN